MGGAPPSYQDLARWLVRRPDEVATTGAEDL